MAGTRRRIAVAGVLWTTVFLNAAFLYYAGLMVLALAGLLPWCRTRVCERY